VFQQQTPTPRRPAFAPAHLLRARIPFNLACSSVQEIGHSQVLMGLQTASIVELQKIRLEGPPSP